MGLDMFLQGHEYRYQYNQEKTLDDFPIKEIIVELGYWRKHSDLHGAIVQNFADGTDNCEPIELNEEDVNKIIEMIKSGDLPATSGFFFGQSARLTENEEAYEEQAKEDIEQFENALKWIKSEVKDGYRWVTYRGSW
jgi:4-alpha-glucanotransferase